MTEWSHLERQGTSPYRQDKNIGMIASAALDARMIVAAVKNAKSNLQVIVYQLFEDGTVDRIASEEGDPTSSTGICVLSDTRFLTASRTASKKLELTVWDFDISNGSIIKRDFKPTNEDVHENFAIATVRGPEITVGSPSSPGTSSDEYLVVTAVRDSQDLLKLISWRIKKDGTIERISEQHEQSGDKVREISVAAYDSYPHNIGSFATAVTFIFQPGTRSSKPRLKVISWKIDTDGTITQQGHEFGNDEIATDLLASHLSYMSIITTYKKSNDTLVIQKWYFNETGNVNPGATEQTAGPVTVHSVTSQNTTRVFTAVGDADGDLKIILWDATGSNIVRFKSATGGSIKKVSVVPLGANWISTLVVDKEDVLKAIAWREHSLSLLNGEWVGSGASPTITETSTSANVPDFGQEPNFAAGSGIFDPMIAVGRNFVIASQDHGIIFLDKSGVVLPPKAGEKVALTMDQFFETFTKNRVGSGSLNENCIGRHMGFSSADNMFYPPGHTCDPDSNDPPCIDEFFDTRVHFDPQKRRFFIFATCRNRCKLLSWNGDCWRDGDVNVNHPDNPLNRRYFAFAISKTEDPRDGFYQWLSTEAFVADAPEFTVNRGVMVISKQIISTKHVKISKKPFGFSPWIYVLSVDDLIDGKPYPRSHKFFKKDIPNYSGGDLGPLTHYGYTQGRTFLINLTPNNTKEINVYSFENPSDWTQVGPIDHTKAVLSIDVGGLFQRERPVYRNKKIYFTWQKWEAGQNPTWPNNPARYSIHIVRLPLDATLQASTSVSDGFLYYTLPQPNEPNRTYFSLEEPTITVTKNDDMLILYCRTGYDGYFNFSTQYFVIRANEPPPTVGTQSYSHLVKSGQFRPLALDNDGNVIIPNTFFTPGAQMHYHTAVIDPDDEETVWMITDYAKKVDEANQDGYRTVIRAAKVE